MGLLDGQVAIITGAGGGLGRAYARLLAAKVRRSLVNDLNGEAADAVVAEIAAAGGRAAACVSDVASAGGRRGHPAPRSRPSAASTSSSTTPASCATRASPTSARSTGTQ